MVKGNILMLAPRSLFHTNPLRCQYQLVLARCSAVSLVLGSKRFMDLVIVFGFDFASVIGSQALV